MTATAGAVLAWVLAAEGATPSSTPRPFTREGVLEQQRPAYPEVALPSDTLPPGVAAAEDVAYTTTENGPLHLDVYRPSGPGPYPAVLLVHGGGWESGDRRMERPLAKALAGRGYVSAPVTYRLGVPGRFPAALHDLKAAVRWLRTNAAAYRIDPRRIGVVGGSAGGQLAALLGATNGMARFEGPDGGAPASSRVQAVVDIDGLADFTGPALLEKEKTSPGAPTRFLGGAFEERTETWRDASALTHAGSASAPTLFITSSAPTPILPGRPETCARLKAAGVACEIVRIEGTPHPFWLLEPWFGRTVDEADRFLEGHLRGPRP